MEVDNVADNSTLRQEIAMDNSVIAQISEVEGRVVKTLILPDGQTRLGPTKETVIRGAGCLARTSTPPKLTKSIKPPPMFG